MDDETNMYGPSTRSEKEQIHHDVWYNQMFVLQVVLQLDSLASVSYTKWLFQEPLCPAVVCRVNQKNLYVLCF